MSRLIYVLIIFSAPFIAGYKYDQDENYESFDDILLNSKEDNNQNFEILKKKHWGKHQGNKWDDMLFTQSWPPTECILWRLRSKRHSCRNIANNEEWTIHGIWPTRWGTLGPFFCDRSDPFNLQEIADLIPRMNKKWAPIEEFGNGYDFWKHEWEKHGTCAKQLPQLSTEHQYFSQALNWKRTYNLDKLLSSGGITQGKEYQITDIWTVLTKTLGVNPQIKCFKHKHMQFLVEIRLCFDKSLSLIDCQGLNDKSHYYEQDSLYPPITANSDCHSDSPVVYPSAETMDHYYYM